MQLPFQNRIFDGLPQAYLVGGSVRDMVRKVQPLDLDVVVPTEPFRFARLLATNLDGKVITLGKERFNVHRVVSEDLSIDVTAIKGDDIHSDLLARDFTINAIAFDLTSGKIIDPLGGMADLRKGRIKMVSPDAFSNDPARLIRAFRMATTMAFQIAPGTLRAIAGQAGAIRKVAGERIWAELELILVCPNSLPTISLMAESHLLLHLIPELRPLMGCSQNRHHNTDVFTHTLQAYRALEELLADPQCLVSPSAINWATRLPSCDQVMIKTALLFHDLGKPASRGVKSNGSVHFYGHAERGAVLARSIGQRLRMPNRQLNRIESVIRHHQRPLFLFLAQDRAGLRPRALGRFFRLCSAMTPYILIHAVADDAGKAAQGKGFQQDGIVFYLELMERYFESALNKMSISLINGHDLMKIFGIPPSPFLGKILKSIKELQVAGVLGNRDQAIKWVTEYLEDRSGMSDR